MTPEDEHREETNETQLERRGFQRGGPDGLRSDGRGPRGGGRRSGLALVNERRGHQGSPRRGGPKRPLAHGDLRLLILKIIETTPSHGYGLIGEIKNLTKGSYEPSPGVIYPALEALQDLGWVELEPEKGKRMLHITEAGRNELAQQTEALETIKQRLEKLASREHEFAPEDVRGAMRQLRHTTISVVKNQSADLRIRKTAVAILQDARKKIAALA